MHNLDLFQRQFLLSRSAAEVPVDWRTEQIGDWVFQSHPTLSVVPIVSAGNLKIGWLLGQLIDLATATRAGRSLVDLVDVEGKIGKQGGAPPGAQGRNMDHFCLRVDPFDGAAIQAHLKAHGVEPGAVEQRYGAEGDGPSIYFTDPEGNTIELKGPADP